MHQSHYIKVYVYSRFRAMRTQMAPSQVEAIHRGVEFPSAAVPPDIPNARAKMQDSQSNRRRYLARERKGSNDE
jgi:hypothetical protein